MLFLRKMLMPLSMAALLALFDIQQVQCLPSEMKQNVKLSIRKVFDSVPVPQIQQF